MKEGIGYTVTLNIMITFIIVVFAFLSAAIIYFKSNKVSNVVIYSIEKYEGYNTLSKKEIALQMKSLGYDNRKVNCGNKNTDYKGCSLKNDGSNGYCVYECPDDSDGYYYYRIRTNMVINIPIINDILSVPIYASTNYMYDYEENLK